jgi:hypothetical protein
MKRLIKASSNSQIVDFGGVRMTEAALDYIWRSVGRNLSASTIIAARNQWSWEQSELDNVNDYLENWDIESRLGFAVPMNYHEIKSEHVQFNEISDEHMIQRIKERLGISWEQLQTDEGKEQVRATLQSYIDNAIVRFKQHALTRKDDKVVRKAKGGTALNNSVYISGGDTVIIEISSDARIVTFYTANEYAQNDKNTELVIKVVKRCNTETLDISIPPQEL